MCLIRKLGISARKTTHTAQSPGCVARVLCLKSRFIASPTTRERHIIVMSLAWGLNGSVFQCSERASAQGQALGQIHLQLNCIRKVKCSARCYFSGITSVAQSTVSSLAPIAILLTPEPTGCKEQLNSCSQWLLAHLFLKGIFTWVFIYFFWWRFVFILFWFPIYVISTRH